MKSHLPEEWERVECIASIVPDALGLPGYPFTGLVLNIQAITEAHEDPMDGSLCMVIPFGPAKDHSTKPWNDGQLCFGELGIVWELTNYQPILFDLQNITHFNLKGDGYRCSMVLSIDKALFQFKETNRNHWGHHMNTGEQI